VEKSASVKAIKAGASGRKAADAKIALEGYLNQYPVL